MGKRLTGVGQENTEENRLRREKEGDREEENINSLTHPLRSSLYSLNSLKLCSGAGGLGVKKKSR